MDAAFGGGIIGIVVAMAVIMAMAIVVVLLLFLLAFLLVLRRRVVLRFSLLPTSIPSFFLSLPSSLGLFPAFSRSRAPCQGSAMNSGCASAL